MKKLSVVKLLSNWWGIFWLFFLLATNAFFVAAEFAVISARRAQIEPRAEAGSKRAKTALYAMEHATLMLATSQLGITVSSLIILNVSEPAINSLLAAPLALLGISAQAVAITGFILTLVIVSSLHVVFGEMVPKNAAFSMPDKAVIFLAPPLVFVSRIFKPVIWSLNSLANGLLRLFGVEPKSETSSTFTLEEVANIVTHSEREGVLEDTTGTLRAAFEFTTKTAGSLYVALDKMITIPESSTVYEAEAAVAKHGFSRYLVANQKGQITGYIHIKDLLRISRERMEFPLPKNRIRPLLNMNVEETLEDALQKMQESGTHIANVFDENKTQLGVLFLEDIVEELVGEVNDATTRHRFEG